MLDDEARNNEDAADPLFVADAATRRANQLLAQKYLLEAIDDLTRLRQHDPDNDVWKADRGQMEVRAGVILWALHGRAASDDQSRRGLADLKEVIAKGQSSPLILDQAANAFVTARPESLRDPTFAVRCAERELAASQGRTPFMLLTSALANRAAGQDEKAREAAKEGLRLLPPQQPGSTKPMIRMHLEFLARPGS